MKLKTLNLSLLSLILSSGISYSEIKVANLGVITGTFGAASQYVSKGVDANRDQPTASLTAEFASNSDIQLILGAGIFYSRPDKPVTSGGNYDYEFDYNIGLRKTIDKLTFDVGHITFSYPSANSNLNLDSSSFYAKASFAATKETTFAIYYEADDTKGSKPISAKTGDNFYELSLSHNFGPATLNLAYGDFNDNATYYKAGLSKELFDLNFNVDYISNNLDRKSWASSWKDKEFVVVGVSKAF